MRFTLTLREDQHARLLARSQDTGMPVSEQIRRATDRWLDGGMAEWAAAQAAKAIGEARPGRKK